MSSLDESSFLDFVAEATPSVVFLAVHPLHPFNENLPQQLQEAGLAEVRFGTLTLMELVLGKGPVLPFLVQATRPANVLPGYYLFIESQLLAYDSGLPLRAEAPHLIRGAALGAVVYGFTGQSFHVLEALLVAAHGSTSPRIAKRFVTAASRFRSQPRDANTHRPAPSRDELAWAYALLGVPGTATDAEVNHAWRKLRVACHPDHAASDPAEFERRSELSREMNRARDVIFAARARRRQAA